jgi:DNA polymerase-1
MHGLPEVEDERKTANLEAKGVWTPYTEAPLFVPPSVVSVMPVANPGKGQDFADPLTDRLLGMVLQTGDDTYTCTMFGAVASFLEDPDVLVCTHNAKVLYQWAWRRGVTVRGDIFDTQLASYLLDPLQPHTLHTLAHNYLGHFYNILDATADAEEAMRACHAVTCLRAPMREALRLKGLDALWQEEIALVPVLARMECDGICLDDGVLQAMTQRALATMRREEEFAHLLIGKEVLLTSTKQLAQRLYQELGLPRGKKTKTGYSTDSAHLRSIADMHEGIPHVLAYRKAQKMYSTYLEPLPRLRGEDNRLHCKFNQTVTQTGRLSSSGPNLQNIPIKGEEGKALRHAFVASPGNLLVCGDYSQIELRVLAHIAQDESMIRVFTDGGDLHLECACKLFDVPPGDVTGDMRRMAKIVNFSIPYGTTAVGLSGQIGSTEAFSQELVTAYLTRFPKVAAYIRDTIQQARKDGYASTLLGRRRPVPDITHPSPHVKQHAERAAINHPIQGTAADIMKRALVRLGEVLPSYGAKLLLQVHDEVVVECPEGVADTVARVVETTMAQAYVLDVPLLVEAHVGRTWGEAK